MNAYIVNSSSAYEMLFREMGYQLQKTVIGADLVVFTGGEDVSPSYYGDYPHPATYNSTVRDMYEKQKFDIAYEQGIPMVGICRGGQFLNVMCGGRMYQHVSKHAVADGHMMNDVDTGEQVFVSSTHHQMMMPSEHARTVATTNLGGIREWYDGQLFRRDESNTDFEVLFYETQKCLCFQPHPEFFGEKYDGMREYFRKLLITYLGQELV